MGPERSGTVSDHLKEEYGFDRRCCLDQMFTKKEPAFAEVWTGANPTARFQSLLNAFLQEGNSRKRPMSLVAKSSLR